jgi:hypothetical protein
VLPGGICYGRGIVVLLGLSTAIVAEGGDDVVRVDVNRGGVVDVSPIGEWHVNRDYPWSVRVGGEKFAFELRPDRAVARGVPAGEGVVRGAVCSESQCRNFQRTVQVLP